MNVVLGKGDGSNSVWLGHDEHGRRVYRDFSYPIFAVLVGRKRSFKSSLLRVIVEGLLDGGNGFSSGSLPTKTLTRSRPWRSHPLIPLQFSILKPRIVPHLYLVS